MTASNEHDADHAAVLSSFQDWGFDPDGPSLVGAPYSD